LSSIRKLAGQTAIYGLSSIVGRFLNYLLTPLYTAKWVFPPEEYGLITTFYAWAAIVGVTLLYGMETTFFRFASRKDGKPTEALATAFTSVLGTTLLFWIAFYLWREPLAHHMGFGAMGQYVLWFALIMGLDALTAIPMARLRQEGRATRFATISLVNVFVNIGLNLFFIAYCKKLFDMGESNALIDAVYDPSLGVGYVFLINVISTGVKALLLLPYFPWNAGKHFDTELLRRMWKFTAPLLVIGLAGMINEAGDRILLKWLLDPIIGSAGADAQVGIYGACYKLSILITLFIQAFRYAAEPFFFASADDKDSDRLFARIMNIFVAAVMGMFLTVVLFLDVIKYFIPNEAFHVGLPVVPILLLANVLLGIYYNLSIWYKLSDRTRQGGYIALVGAAITISVNLLFIPVYGYMASAWATLACYSAMVVISYLLGKRHYPIPYDLTRIFTYMGLALAFWRVSDMIEPSDQWVYVVNGSALIGYALFVLYTEKRKTSALAS
jgi:O-antigen/teichoic acid export membrane protein